MNTENSSPPHVVDSGASVMNDQVAVIDAFDKWWTTRPEPHISSPKQSHMKMQQDRMLAIWLSAWDAAKAHSAINETKKKVE